MASVFHWPPKVLWGLTLDDLRDWDKNLERFYENAKR